MSPVQQVGGGSTPTGEVGQGPSTQHSQAGVQVPTGEVGLNPTNLQAGVRGPTGEVGLRPTDKQSTVSASAGSRMPEGSMRAPDNNLAFKQVMSPRGSVRAPAHANGDLLATPIQRIGTKPRLSMDWDAKLAALDGSEPGLVQDKDMTRAVSPRPRESLT